jgi:hypothetical protein
MRAGAAHTEKTWKRLINLIDVSTFPPLDGAITVDGCLPGGAAQRRRLSGSLAAGWSNAYRLSLVPVGHSNMTIMEAA